MKVLIPLIIALTFLQIGYSRSPAVENFSMLEVPDWVAKKQKKNTPVVAYDFKSTRHRSPSSIQEKKIKIINKLEETQSSKISSFNFATFLSLTFLIFFPFALWALIMGRLDNKKGLGLKLHIGHKDDNTDKNDNDDFDLPKAS